MLKVHLCTQTYVITKQGDSDSEVIICFGTKFKLSVDLIQLLKMHLGLGIYLTSLS